jgi:CRP-like cAMP-binding protein
LSDEVLEGVVEFLKVVTMRKGEIIYEQDSEPTHIFFLQEGEVKIEKTSHLFVENPN